VLKVDHNPGHITGGSGAQYFVGDFDGTTFTAETPGPDAEPQWVDFGADFYCAMTFSNEPDADVGTDLDRMDEQLGLRERRPDAPLAGSDDASADGCVDRS
jgi:sucrose-6-phosphate hydrolase SacC (GH32 family)